MCSAADPEEIRRARIDDLNRSLILDAAEEPFALHGYQGASIREIARRAGLSSGALYLYFDNKADLYSQMLLRRGAEISRAMAEAAESAIGSSLDRFHRMADAAIANYLQRPHWAQIVARANAAQFSPMGEWRDNPDERIRQQYQRAMEVEVGVIRGGQQRTEIRAGDPRALAYLFSVLVNSYLAVSAPATDDERRLSDTRGGLTLEQLHEIIDGAFRSPLRSP